MSDINPAEILDSTPRTGAESSLTLPEQARLDQAQPDQAALELTQFSKDMLALVDLVCDFSNNEELITKEALKLAFSEKIQKPPASTAQLEAEWIQAPASTPAGTEASLDDSLQAQAEPDAAPGTAPDPEPVSVRAERRVLSRRALFTTLLSSMREAGSENLSVPATQTAEAALSNDAAKVTEVTDAPQAGEPRVLNDSYFDELLTAAMASTGDLAVLHGWDKVDYYHYKPLLSVTYALILSAKENPMLQMAETVRSNSREYPRPLALDMFEYPPFNFTPEMVNFCLKKLSSEPGTADIQFTESSVGTIYLYSSTYLNHDYATFLAENQDMGAITSP